MPADLVIEEVHITVFVARGLPAPEYRAIRRTLAGTSFRTRLKRAVDDVVRGYPSLRKTKQSVSQ
jgi:hypothetical protein